MDENATRKYAVTSLSNGNTYGYDANGNQTTRIAMRKYTIPRDMHVEYFLRDHLVSTSITTDSAGAKVSEMRYKPWGEVRYHKKDMDVTLPKYAFTGQFSYMDNPSTTTVTEGFRLIFYNARWCNR